jgi:glycosyltransferase involved in cell wall biosynthesis
VPATASIVIPTRGRPAYLDVTLASVVPQAAGAGAEVIVVGDGVDAVTEAVARKHEARYLALDPPAGANAARNAGIRAARGELIVLIDDDVDAPAGWLGAYLEGAARAPECEVFGGPIRALLEGGGPRACGREPPPITTLELGAEDREADLVWSANMAVRRRALEAVGPFDETLLGCGEEEDWLRRYRHGGGGVRYLAAAGLTHRRTARDATLSALARTAYRRGRAARRYDVRKGTAPARRTEIRTLAGCAWHLARRRCANGIVLGAHTAGRLREALAE